MDLSPQPQPTFYKTWNPPANPTLQLQLVSLTTEDLEEAVNLAARCFTEKDPLVVHCGIPFEEYYSLVRPYAERSIQEDLGVVFKDTATNKIISLSICTDYYNEDKTPLDYRSIFKNKAKYFAIGELLENFKTFDELKATQPNEIIHEAFIATSPEYAKLGINTELTKFLLKEHPKVSKAKLAFQEAINGVSQKIATNTGWVLLDEVVIESYQDSNGVNPFLGYEKTVERLNWIPSKGVKLFKYKIN